LHEISSGGIAKANPAEGKRRGKQAASLCFLRSESNAGGSDRLQAGFGKTATIINVMGFGQRSLNAASKEP
jgi:hypothetical protein